MHRILRLILLVVITLLSLQSIASEHNTAIKWHEWSNETFALAAKENKLILLDISAEWCQFCKKMKAVTYKDAEVIKIIHNNYIAIHADIETTADVQMLYGNLGVPGTVILTSARDEINKRLGYIAPQQMQWHLLGSLQDAPDKTISTLNSDKTAITLSQTN